RTSPFRQSADPPHHPPPPLYLLPTNPSTSPCPSSFLTNESKRRNGMEEIFCQAHAPRLSLARHAPAISTCSPSTRTSVTPLSLRCGSEVWVELVSNGHRLAGAWRAF